MNAIQQLLTDHLDIWTAADTEKKTGRGRASGIAESVYGIKKLRELILELAVRGKLVRQDANDEPAGELFKRIQSKKAKLITEGKIKKYKPLPIISEEEKPFELPQGWIWSRLGLLGNTQTGSTPSKSDPESFGSDVPFIKPGDIYPNYVDYGNEGLSFQGAKQSGRIAQSGSILMVCIGTIGKCNLIDRDCSFNQQINSVTPFLFDSHYLLSVCRSVFFHTQAWSKSSSTTIAILNKGNWEEICIPIPPLEEQHRIVAKVDELMALCDQLESRHYNAAEAHEKLVSHLLGTLTQSQNAKDFSANWQRIAAHFETMFTTEASIDDLKQTLLQLAVMGKLVPQDSNEEPASELFKRIQVEKAKLIAEGKIKKDKPLPEISGEELPFELPQGWEWVRLHSVIDVRDGTHDSPKEAGGAETYPLVTSKDFFEGRIYFDGARRISKADHIEIAKRSLVEKYDILFSMIGGNIGNQVIVEDDRPFSIKNVALFKYYDRNLTFPFFIKKYMENLAVNLQATAVGGAQPFVALGALRILVMALPPLAEQHRIVAKVDELMALCHKLKIRIVQANQLQQKLADVVVERAIV